MKLFSKKNQEKKLTNITKLEKSQLEKVIGGVDSLDSTTLTESTSYVEGGPIGGVIVKGGKNPGGQITTK